jgi:hypothetical protein
LPGPGLHSTAIGARGWRRPPRRLGPRHVVATIESTDGGASFGPAVDLVAAAGIQNASQAFVSPGPRGPLGVCVVGLDAGGADSARCAVAPATGAAWAFHDIGATWDNSYTHAPDAVAVSSAGTLLVTQIAASDNAIFIHRSGDGGSSWSVSNVPFAGWGGHALRPLSADVTWFLEVDDNNDASLVRLTGDGTVAAPREWLFGDARRLDGSGQPWVATADDGAGEAVMVFSLPDPLRGWVTAARVLK